MQFQTQVPISNSSHLIGYRSKTLSLGSCFAVHMADKLRHFQFSNEVNPFGILFHPKAIQKAIGFASDHHHFTASDVFFHNERWHCFDAHSDLSDVDATVLVQKLNDITSQFRNQIQSATHLIITYGTAWAYREKTGRQLVANCHKMPQQQFDKELLSVETIAASVSETIKLLYALNPKIKIIFTISPVRHLKDGLVENQRSKAHLIAGLHQAISGLSDVSYFPSYEIMMDELRDYRFYAQDMLHPSDVAIDYIWQRFSQTHISGEAFAVMEKVDSIRKGLAHRPFHAESDSHQLFVSRLQQSILELQREFAHMQF